MLLNSILCIGLTVVTLTFGNELNGDEPQEDAPDKGDASYEFGYDIHNPVSNDIKSHHEIRDGKNVLGFYTFKEADGSIRIVKYKVGPTTGFEAVVERLPPDPLSGNSIDGQEASPSTHGVPQTVSEPNGGHNSRYVAGVTETHSSGNRNQHGNERNNVQVYPNRNPSIDSDRRYHEPQQNYPGRRHRDPYIIRRNLQYRNNQQHLYENGQKPQYSDQRFVPQEQYIGAPRGRQRNQFINPNIIQPNVPYTNNIVQPSAYGNEEIIYIDGIPYINDVGAYYDSQGQLHIPNQEQTQNPPYQVEEKPESSKTEEQATENDSNDNEEYEEDDDDVEDDHAKYEEEDDEDDDEDVDASDFFEQNQKLADKQKEEYDKLKRAYEEEGQVTEENEEEKEQPKTETAPQDDSQQQI